MADETLDSLSLEIKSDADKASDSIEKLEGNLSKLSGTIDQLNLSKLGAFSSELDGIRTSADKLRGINLGTLVNKMDVLNSVISNQTTKLMNQLGITGKRAFEDIRGSVVKYTKAQEQANAVLERYRTQGEMGFEIDYGEMEREVNDIAPSINDITSAIERNVKATVNMQDGYRQLAEYVRELNKSGKKIYISPEIKSDMGENFNHMIKTLGSAFTSTQKDGMSFDSWINSDLNPALNGIIENAGNASDAFTELYEKLQEGRKKTVISGDDIYGNLIPDKNAVIGVISEIMQSIEMASEQINADGGIKDMFEVPSQTTSLRQAVENITAAVRQKTEAFSHEGTKVKAVMDSEIDDVERLRKKLSEIGALNLSFNLDGNAISGIGQLANSVGDIKTVYNNLKELTSLELDSRGIQGMANALGQLGRKTVTQAAENLPRLSAQFRSFSENIRYLDRVEFDVDGLAQLTSAISRLGGKNATAAPQNIREVSSALSDMMRILSRAPMVSQNLIQMTNAMANLAGRGNQVASASRSLTSSLFNFGKSAKAGTSHGKGLASVLGKLYASYWLVFRAAGALKDSIDISSQLTEVQNVVNSTFGEYSGILEEMAATSITDFGMSELTLKQIASRYQAMGTAMGFTQGRMAEMSTELAALTADMASFYNVQQDVVADDFAAIFTGQTEPLRKYGLDLTQATVQEWAWRQGIEANMETMTQAQKTLLRYQYVLANTTAAQGDFARTSMTWANQVRILQQNFQALGSTVGGVLINVLRPLVIALNKAMTEVLDFAQTVADALGAIFGWTIEITPSGIAEDIGDITSGIEDAGLGADGIGDGLDKANSAAKELKKTILGFDELNVLNSPTTYSGKGGKGDNGLDTGLGDISGADASLVRVEGIVEKYKSEIDNLYELGEYIGDTLTNVLKSIDWESVYEGADDFGIGLADFLNGLISPDLFGAVGTTIAGSLNTALHFLDSFGDQFEWDEFGESIAAGVNDFFATFDFALLGNTLSTWAGGLFTAFSKALKTIDWSAALESVGDFFDGIEVPEEFDGFVELLSSLYDILVDIGTGVGSGLIEFLSDFAETATPLLNLGASGVAWALERLSDVLNTMPGQALLKGIGAGLGAIGVGMGALKTYKTLESATIALASAAKTFSKITGLGKVATVIADLATSIGLLPTGFALLGATAGISGLGLSIKNLIDSLTHVDKFESGYENEITQTAKDISSLQEALDSLADTSEQDFKNVLEVLDKFLNLNDKKLSGEGLSASESQLFTEYYDTLVKYAPEIASLLGDIENGYKGSKEELIGLLEKQKEQALSKGYLTIIEEIGKELAESQLVYRELENQMSAYDTAVLNAKGATSETAEALKTLREEVIYGTAETDEFNMAFQELSRLADEGAIIIDGVAVSADDLWDAYNNLGLQMEESQKQQNELTETMQVAETELKNVASEAANTGDSFSGLSSDVQSTMNSANTSVSEGMSGIWSTLSGAVENMKTAANDSILNPIIAAATEAKEKAPGIAGETVGGMASGINLNSDQVVRGMRGIANSMATIIKGVNWYNVGWNIPAGLWSGISGNSGGLLANIASLGSNLLSTFKSVLGIHSPSQEFEDAAGFIMKGLKLGLLSGEGGVLATVQSMAEHMQDAFHPVLSWDMALAGLQNNYALAGIPVTATMDGMIGQSKQQMETIYRASIQNDNSIALAIEQAVTRAMMYTQQNQRPIEVTSYIEVRTEDDEVLARAVQRGQESIDYRNNYR